MHCKTATATVVAIVGCLNGVFASDRRPDIAVSPPASTRPLIVGDVSGRTVAVFPDDVAKLRRTTVRERIPHSTTMVTYEGVLLGEVLRKAGIEFEDKARSSGEMPASLRSSYVLIEAADGYQVVFSISEVDPMAGDRAILLASRRDGRPLDAKATPYQVIVPGSKSWDRWIQQVTRILVRPASSSAFVSAPAAASLSDPKTSKPGLYLLGMGPGSPDLTAPRATQILRAADVVLCFSWMKDELTPLARPGTIEVASPLLMGGQYCGRKPDEIPADLRERVAQTNEEAAKLKARIQKAISDGKTVAVADNGDPTMFSPWNWITVSFADLHPVVVPGMSSVNAANAVLGQGVVGVNSLTISSGEDLGTPGSDGRLPGTIVFYTHRIKFEDLVPRLRARYPADTPVVIVCDASYPTQRVVTSDLGRVLGAIKEQALPHLYLVYVGDALKQTPIYSSPPSPGAETR